MQLTDNQLWQSLHKQQLVSQELAPDATKSPWYIRALMGFTAWVSACFLFGFFAFLVFSSGSENGFVAAIIGGVSCALAFAMFSSQKQGVFGNQLALAFNMSGQLLIGIGLFMVLDDLDLSGADSLVSLLIIFFVIQLLLSFIMPDYISRMLSSWFAMMALFWVLKTFGLAALSLPLVAVLFISVWVADAKWRTKSVLWEPIGYGLTFSLVVFSGNLLMVFPLFEFMEWLDEPIDMYLYSYWLGVLAITLCFGYLLKVISHQFQIAINSRMGVSLVLLCILFSVISYFIAGASAGLLLILVGFFKQRRMLVVLGVLSLLGFVSWYYYSLNWTLLYKSIVLIGFGGLFALILLIMKLADKKAAGATFNIKNIYVLNTTNIIAIAMMALILGALNFNIYQKEKILAKGQVVLLTLAPVDPRSLMQGDYMRLRFAIERRISEREQGVDQGLFVVDLDAFEVASFNSLYSGQTLTENQVKMQFRIRDNRLQLATHAFFFQEGTASEYEAAVYGEFRVADNGELLLNALRDKEYKVIGYNRPGN